MAELTRFDFHVHRFLNSETVESMTDAEIGQYFLLLCKSFVSGKAASLPDDPKYLAKWARCRKVSAKVLQKFPIIETEWGPRRRNDTMYGEWLVAIDRSASASERGRKGNEIRWGSSNGDLNGDRNSDSHSDPLAFAKGIAQSYQSIKPINNTITKVEFKGGSFGQGKFKTVRTHWYSHFQKRLMKTPSNQEQYTAACCTYGEDKVLDYLKTWAKNNEWVAAHARGDNRLYIFLEELSSMIDGDVMRTSSESVLVAEKEINRNLIAQTLVADDEVNQRENEEFRRKKKEEEELAKLSEGVLF